MNELSEVQREKLVTDLKNVIQDAEELLKAGIAGMLTSSLVKARPGSVLSRS